MLDQQVVLEVEGIEERYPVNACTQPFNFRFYLLNIAEVIWLFALEACQFFLGFTQFCAAAARQGDAPGMR
ncbi:hypothetical protein D3C77_661550 [compost metagenome]